LTAPVRLDEVAGRVCADLAPAAAEKGIDLSPATLEADNREPLYVLLRDLADNAIRYTPEIGEIVVAVRRDIYRDSPRGFSRASRQIVVEVGDSGCGVAKEDLPALGQRAGGRRSGAVYRSARPISRQISGRCHIPGDRPVCRQQKLN